MKTFPLHFLAAVLGLLPSFSPAECPTYDPPANVGTVQSSALTEISGIASSRLNPGVLWVHNDSGDTARVFALNSAGTLLGTYNFSGATAVDWEDIAVGPGPEAGRHYLYLSDTGNNALDRSTLTIYRISEPAVGGSSGAASLTLVGVQALKVQYPNGARYDCETLLVDPIYGDILLVTRDRSLTGTSYVFKYPAPQDPSVTATLQLVATITGAGEIKGGDVSAAGDLVILRPHSMTQQLNALVLARSTVAPAEPIEKIFRADNPVCSSPLAAEPQGEAVGFAADGSGYFTVSEGVSQPIFWCSKQAPVTAVPPAPTAVTTAIGNAQVQLTWSLSATANSYTVKRATTTGGPYTPLATVTPTSFTDSTVQNGVAYYYVVSASNALGESSPSREVSVNAGSPTAPGSLSARVSGSKQIELTWIDNAANEDGFQIERALDGVSFKQSATAGANTVRFVNTGLVAGKTYSYRVRAYNGLGTSAYSNTASAKAAK